MKKLLIIILGLLIIFAGCISDNGNTANNNTNINNSNTNSSTNSNGENKTLFQQIQEEAMCPCSTLVNLRDCKKYFPDCKYTANVDSMINSMILEGKTKAQILDAVDSYNNGIIEEKLKDFKNSQKEGRVILVYFKSSLCEICHEKEPVFNQIKEKYKGKIDIYVYDRIEDSVIFEYFAVDRIPSIVFYDGNTRLNEVPYNNITLNDVSNILDFTLDKKK
ncbi:MAG: Thioredoxin [Candidatus Methanofastidiosum methylothiophilum]|jgi:thiol-disulfide isomerase/thioredoxin|uniref:Thioredoxin n=1 Tax=Candidatus Methanofastidiosum methylothiophilum TaxID=1705564 RepID=A0A150J7K0_9EURY|nr:MAG: Thioredoxin [Candidatus Methanofastidiosum methylthiophilus]NMC76584.1 thioredoxin family protein [Candidatus Methanofastidiosa archaeon]